MEQRYRELFDGVRAPERLRSETLRIPEKTAARRRKIPRAALIAAALVLVLAGTALAAELLGKVHIGLIGTSTENPAGSGYEGYAEFERIPVENLSPKAVQAFSELENGVGTWRFGSWAEAEEFLGLELARSSILDQISPAPQCRVWAAGQPASEDCPAAPLYMKVSASYLTDGLMVSQDAWIEFSHPGQAERELGGFGLGTARSGEVFLENYAASGGIEAVIVTAAGTRYAPGGAFDRTRYIAYFVRDHAFFTVSVQVNGTPEQPESVRALEVLKSVLDGCE